jgi:hypothetical protein
MGCIATAALPRRTTPILFCVAHLARTGSRVPADRVIDGEAFCRACFRGQPISPAEEFREESKSQQNFSTPRKQNRLARSESEKCSTDSIPASHRLTALETKLLNALQEILVDETIMLAAIHRYRIPLVGRKKKPARARRGWPISAHFANPATQQRGQRAVDYSGRMM